eukprot:gb/GEZN01007205.1/.p1 GENE.gb/GEZN01007205.1/~~gb/GEZN01007205.1/.p1  ORF type:complete len:364 (-),score=49.26 gb/GEZN01007205.1/:443-1534(-)
MSAPLGYFGALTAVVFFGSSYVPTKKYDTYDGMIFQWFMCSGILSLGLAWGLLTNNWYQVAEQGLYVFPEGLLGGALWASANMLIPTVVNMLGFGPGFMIWNGGNLVASFFVARYGLFGVQVSEADKTFSNGLGIVFILLSIVVFGMIKPSVTPKKGEKQTLLPHTTPGSPHENSLPPQGLYELGAEAKPPTEPQKDQRVAGIFLAVFVGCLLGNSLTPFANWMSQCPVVRKANPDTRIIMTCSAMDFLFSQCVGIYIVSTIAFIFYSMFKKWSNKSMPRSALRPAYIAGILWGIGLAGQLLSAGNLGYAAAYPLTAIGPAIVSMLWSLLYFKEIEGKRNVTLMLVATTMVVIGVLLQNHDKQ